MFETTTDNYQTIRMEVDNFKSAIIRIRDILRTVPITGMNSMQHICLYIMSRFITIENAGKLGIPDRFAWENIMEMIRRQNGGLQFALDFFYHPEAESLISHFDRLFGTDKFQFDIIDLHKHKEILEILDNVNMELVDCEMDILGWVYEQHLKTGSSSAGRDLGQFFTDRFICEYMTELCAPRFKSPGVPESVCDPTMGTGGFLTAYVKYFRKKHAGIQVNWSVQQKEIHGCDNDKRVSGVACMNLFMELGGIRAENLYTRDSLYKDLLQTKYDVILANMPFGLKGLTHAKCCDRVKDLKIRGTKSEPLFLQLMMVSLNQGGRCAVVVPDGMLVNNTKLHTDTRKYLMEHFEVERIIKMKGKFFMNTSIQPSVIFFKNTGNPTTEVQFWEVVKNENNEVEETMVVSVPREKLDDAYTFDMRRYMVEETPAVNPAGFPMVKLEKVCSVSFGERITQKHNKGTEYPVYGSGEQTFKTNKFNRDGKYCKVGRFAISESNMVMIVEGQFWLMDSGFTVKSKDEQKMKTEYLWYCLLMDKQKLSTLSSGSCQKNIVMNDFYNVEYPLPPLEIQEEIVATLDRIYTPGTTELADTVKLTNRAMDLVLAQPDGSTLEPIVGAQRLVRKSAQMVVDVKAQMVAIVKSIERRRFEMKELHEVCEIKNGKTLTSKEKQEGGEYDVMGGGTKYIGKTSSFNRDGENISISKSGASAGFVAFHNKKFWAGDCFTLKSKDETRITTRFIYQYLKQNNDKIMSKTSGSTIPHCKWDDIKNMKIPVPSLDFQESVVARLDALQSQLDALQSLQDQSESNARFILESYLQ